MGLNFIKESITIGADKITDKTFTFFKQGFRLSSAIGEPEYRDVTVSGVDVLNLPNAKADGLNYCKLYGKCEQRDLPEGYTEVEYLQSSGTQYIDTGIVLNVTMTVRVKYDYVAQGFVLGSRASTSSYYSGITHESGGSYRIRYGNKVLYNNSSVPTGTVDVVISPDGVTLNGVVVSTTSYGTNFYNGNCYLFTINNNGEAFVGEYAINRIRRFAIDNVINLIPCRRNSDSVLGMYDTVTNTFLTNAGTGTFTAGNDVVPTPTRPLNIICNNGIVKVSPNLFDINNPTYCTGYISTNNNGIIEGSTLTDTFYVKCQPNTTYTLQRDKIKVQNQVFRLATFSTIPQEGVHCNQITGGLTNDLTISITTGNDDVYIGFSMGRVKAGETTYLSGVQLEQSSTATAYRPYKQVYTDGTIETVQDSLNNTATAEMLLAVDNYKDEQEVLSGDVTKSVKILVLDGTEDWSYQSNYSRFSLEVNDLKLIATRECPLLCSHYYVVSDGRLIEDVPNNSMYTSFGPNKIHIKTTDYNNVNDFKEFLAIQYNAGTPVIVIYPLETPTTSTVTAQTLTTKKGTNTIEITQASLTDLPIEVNYKAGVSVTVQQIEDSNLDNQVTVTIGE